MLRSPTLEDLHIQFHSNVPENVELKIDGSKIWDRQGALFGAATAQSQDSSSSFLKRFNDNIPDTGAGFVDLEVALVSSRPGRLILSSFEVTYTMQTVNLAIQIPEGEVLHARAEPYEVVTRHIIG